MNSESARPEWIKTYDDRGGSSIFAREDWERSVLPQTLQRAWNDPQTLYSVLVHSLEDGFVEPLEEASARLLEIDTDHERAAVVRGIILMKLGRFQDAEQVLQNFIGAHGSLGVVLTNLAKVYSSRGDQPAADRTLRLALHEDPNQDNGLTWWAARHRDEGGQQGYLAAVREIAAEPGSSRAQLWLAREALQEHDLPAAMMLYRIVLAAPTDGGALMQMSGDLGNAGHLREAVELVAPLYDPQHHTPHVGMNLARALAMQGQHDAARQLLRRIRPMAAPPFADALSKLDQDIADDAVKANP